MAVFNITDHIVWGGKPRKLEILEWLNANVGTTYGVGDPARDVMYIGAGWEMRVESQWDIITEDRVSEFVVDITDDTQSTLFALKWVN